MEEQGFIKITVLKRHFNEELIKEHLDEGLHDMKICDKLKEGDEFYVTDLFEPPAGMCNWAWADLRSDIMLVTSGGSMPGLKSPNSMISSCSDFFRPVLFKIELLANEG